MLSVGLFTLLPKAQNTLRFFGGVVWKRKGQVLVNCESTNSFGVRRVHPVEIKTRNLLFCICKIPLPKSVEGCWLNSFIPGGVARL